MPYSPLALIITGVGMYMITKIGGILFRPALLLHTASRALKSTESRSSFLLALAGTLGVGNVFGVAYGLLVGGAGSIFWMLVSVLFSSLLKYSEVLLSTAEGGKSGIYSAIKRALGSLPATIYSLGAIVLGFFMGSALQANTIAIISSEIFNTPPSFIAVFLVLITFLALSFGTRIIPKITAVIIPLSTIIYIFLAFSIIIVNFANLDSVFANIITSAFSRESAFGGVFAFLFSRSFSEGFSRGILSNEAGAGTSTLAHGASVGSPFEKGVLGILEVLFDTAVLCPLTGVTLLVAIPDLSVYPSAASLLLGAVSTLGDIFCYPLLFAVFIFGWSTIITWYYYVERSFATIFGTAPRTLVFLYIAFLLFGAAIKDDVLVLVSDICLLSLTVIVSLTVIKSSDRIKALSEQGLLNKSDLG